MLELGRTAGKEKKSDYDLKEKEEKDNRGGSWW